MLAPTTSLSDALALAAANSPRPHASLEYGWVRGAGSAAFIVGTITAGTVVNAYGPAASLSLQAALLAAAAGAALLVPEVRPPKRALAAGSPSRDGLLDLVQLPGVRWVVLVAALVLGSHAMHDSFVMIVWSRADISASVGGILWAESVAAEVLVFLWLGPLLLRHVRPHAGMALAAISAVLRWSLTSQLSGAAAFAFIEPLHGLTFALLHLSCMRILVAVVPRTLAATAQTMYGFGIGAMTAALTFASGWLYARFGPAGFWAKAALAGMATPFIWLLQRAEAADAGSPRAGAVENTSAR
jgi:PPP family 3-phenylpropionic acid transporter